jgi:hypothetical protein
MSNRHYPPSSTVLYCDHTPDATRRTWSYRDFLTYFPFASANGWYSGFHDSPVTETVTLDTCPIGNVLPVLPPGFAFEQGMLAVLGATWYVGVMVSWQPTVVKLYEYTPGRQSVLIVHPIPVAYGQMGLLLADTDLSETERPPRILTLLVAPESDDTITSVQFIVLSPEGTIHTTDCPFAITGFGLFRTFHSRQLTAKPSHPSIPNPSPTFSSLCLSTS